MINLFNSGNSNQNQFDITTFEKSLEDICSFIMHYNGFEISQPNVLKIFNKKILL